MIMLGREVIDREELAAQAGWHVRSLSNMGAYAQLTPVAGGGRGSKALYDLQQAEVLIRNLQKEKAVARMKKDRPQIVPEAIPSLPDYSSYTEHELRGLIRSWLEQQEEDGTVVGLTMENLDAMGEQDLQDWVSGHELLTLEEARLAVPEERRPTPKTWESYYARTKVTSLPDPDRTFFGMDFWFRETIVRWDAEQRRRVGDNAGGHRPAGSKNSTWAPSESMQEIIALSEERRAQVNALHRDRPELTVPEIAGIVGVSPRAAFRYLQEVAGSDTSDREETEHRRAVVRELVQAEPDISGSEVARRLGIGYTTANRYLNELGRENARPEDKAAKRRAQATELLRENPDLTDEDLAARLGVTAETAAAYRRDPSEPTGPTKREEAEQRLARTRKLLTKNPDLEADELAAILGLKPVTAEKYLREAREPKQP
ncbi:hypothetical protein [Kitasatospora sp. NPDC002965]|uniref:winged helix-turn-helix domain-containing protein n=1 Tax=Kitasatospora sp. NPDC002965 TaxID=3154775 RepID=UPI0033A00D29